MKTIAAVIFASITIVSAASALAATIHNNDAAAVSLRVVENSQEQKVELQPSTAAKDLCSTKCDLFIGNDPDPYEISAADVLVIEDGKLYDANEPAQDPNAPKQ